MDTELYLLAWSVALAFAQMLVAAQGAMMQVGLPALISNREGLPEIRGWAGRALRAHRNMVENLVLFAPLVIIAVLSYKTNSTTLLGAHLFFWARLAYAFVYVAGIIWVRTLLWLVSVIGMILIFSQLLLMS